mmetsp:Transcript_51702/g.124804  ORF Transcript_51702/g.124804 Transcript_51702/m.124804 type:complete len:91 (-) Transcript_51702:777-1049(-)
MRADDDKSPSFTHSRRMEHIIWKMVNGKPLHTITWRHVDVNRYARGTAFFFAFLASYDTIRIWNNSRSYNLTYQRSVHHHRWEEERDYKR